MASSRPTTCNRAALQSMPRGKPGNLSSRQSYHVTLCFNPSNTCPWPLAGTWPSAPVTPHHWPFLEHALSLCHCTQPCSLQWLLPSVCELLLMTQDPAQSASAPQKGSPDPHLSLIWLHLSLPHHPSFTCSLSGCPATNTSR